MSQTDFNKRFITARRAAISLDFSHLNEVQREAVLTTQGPLLLLAGAGSGKTTVLMNRIANLLKYGSGSDSQFVPEGICEEDVLLLEEYVRSSQRGPQFEPHNEPQREPHHELHLASQRELHCEPQYDPQRKIAQLCAVDAVAPWQVIAITFTNKAAGEMKERLARLLGPSSGDIWAMTFHSACSRILRRHIDKLGYDTSFTIYDTSDTASLMKRILKDLNVEERNYPPKTILSYISRAKDDMVFADAFLASAEKQADPRRKVTGLAYVKYENRLKSSNALDFDDLILLTVKLFKEHPDVLSYYQKRFRYVLVDEYQDTNNLQYRLASALAGGYGNICVVGDDDQSIYKFRGATIENILSFEKHFKDARVIRLEQNYRSTGHILDAANDVIKNNKGRKGKTLWTEKDSGEKPALHVTADERTEAQFVADRIVAGKAEGRKWQEHVVLYRMNAQSNQFETAFKRSGIPYRILGGTGFYDRAEIKDMLAYLCVIHNPHDDVRLMRIINNPPRGLGDTTIGRLAEYAASRGVSLFEAIDESQSQETLRSSAGKLHQFADMINELREAAATSPLDALYDVLLLRTGYVRMLEEKGTDENIARLENVRELKTNIISFLNDNRDGSYDDNDDNYDNDDDDDDAYSGDGESISSGGGSSNRVGSSVNSGDNSTGGGAADSSANIKSGSLFDFLSETALFTDLDRDDHSADRVLLMTMHSAKGLEFDTVFLVGFEEGVFPGTRSIGDPDEMEEERRLCYVAMTRAMRKLYFTSTQRRMLFGKTSSSQPSRFLQEINSEHIEIHEPYYSFSGYDFDFSGGFSHYGKQEKSSSSSSSQVYSNPGAQRGAGPDVRHSQGAAKKSSVKPRFSAVSATQEAQPDFKKGDSVIHKAFGAGLITGISPVGGDALLEIAFETAGTKRMLLNSAARYMSKA